MKLRIATTATLLALCLPAGAAARTQGAPPLSERQARQALARWVRQDHAASVSIGHCRRLSPSAIRCQVTERGIPSQVTDNGRPITVASLSYSAVVRRTARGKLPIRSSLVEHAAQGTGDAPA